MEKTALTQLKDKMQKIRDESTDPNLIGVAIAMQYYIKELLPTEQQQITDAYTDGLTMGHVTGETADKLASDYFTTKYK
jgi:hypothetical protein